MTPAELLAAIVLMALVVYTLTGGADFGAGVWDLLAVGPRAKAQRDAIARAIAPIWEANHVWLIFVIVMLFVAFPPAFQAISIALHVPLTLMLIGIVLRGTAFVFRTYDTHRVEGHWSRVFAIASIFTPVMLGMSLGTVASGSVRLEDGLPVGGFFTWLAPFPFAIGLFTLALFSLLAAVYLLVEVEEGGLRKDFRLRALVAAAATAALAYASLALAKDGAPPVWDALTNRPWSPAFHVGANVLGVGLFGALLARRWWLARALVIGLVVVVELGWTVGQWPFVVPPDLTIATAAAPRSVLVPILWAIGVGSVFLVPSFVYLYAVFKGPR